MSGIRTRRTIEKQRAINNEYTRLLKAEGLKAMFLDKKYLYVQVAEIFFVEPDYVRKVVNGNGKIKTKVKA